MAEKKNINMDENNTPNNKNNRKEQPVVQTELARELTLFHLIMMGLGMMIGAGVFLGIGNAIYHAGPGGVVLTFSLNGLIALFTAMSYAELSSAIPKAGGAMHFARMGFGNETGFIAGWMEWFASSIAGSMYAITFAIYTVRYFGVIGWLGWYPYDIAYLEKVVAVLVALFFIYINYRGASETGNIGAIMTLGQTIFMLLIGIAGIIVAIKEPTRLANFKPFLPKGWSALLVTMGFTYVAFEGYEVIAQAGDEAIEPRKNLPKAMIYSVVIVTITYMMVSFASVVAVKKDSLGGDQAVWEWIGNFREKGFGEAISRLIPYGNLLLTIAVIFASTSALNATIFSATRASFGLGREGMLPSIFAKVSKKTQTPYGALSLTGLIIIIVAAFLPTMDVASSASIMFLLLFFLVNICVIRIRWNLGDELTYGYIIPLFPLFPILAIVLQGILAIWLHHMSIIAWIIAPIWIITGFIIYLLYSKKRAKPQDHDIYVLEETEAPKGNEYRVMIPVANTDNALHLAVTTTLLCRRKKSRIKILHMLPVSGVISLNDADDYMEEGKRGIIEAAKYLKPLFPITTTIRYCRNVARGIISTVREKKVDLLIMGWHGKIKSSLFAMGSILDPVLVKAPCDIIILKDECKNKQFKNILVPIFGILSDRLAVETAELLLHKEEGNLTLLDLTGGKRKRRGKDYVRNLFNHVVKSKKVTLTEIVPPPEESRDIVKTVLKYSKGHDLAVVSVISKGLFRLGRKTVTEIIASNLEIPFALVKAANRVEKFAKRVL